MYINVQCITTTSQYCFAIPFNLLLVSLIKVSLSFINSEINYSFLFQAVSFVLPSACDLNLTSSDKGWLNAIIFVGMMVGGYSFGGVADIKVCHKEVIHHNNSCVMDGIQWWTKQKFRPTFLLPGNTPLPTGNANFIKKGMPLSSF